MEMSIRFCLEMNDGKKKERQSSPRSDVTNTQSHSCFPGEPFHFGWIDGQTGIITDRSLVKTCTFRPFSCFGYLLLIHLFPNSSLSSLAAS